MVFQMKYLHYIKSCWYRLLSNGSNMESDSVAEESASHLNSYLRLETRVLQVVKFSETNTSFFMRIVTVVGSLGVWLETSRKQQSILVRFCNVRVHTYETIANRGGRFLTFYGLVHLKNLMKRIVYYLWNAAALETAVWLRRVLRTSTLVLG